MSTMTVFNVYFIDVQLSEEFVRLLSYIGINNA
jgi:hypothetical protein